MTRSGSNDFHGSGYFFFRDHNMAAYPGLARSTLDPNPFFARRNPGAWLGGPIIKDKLFFFFNYEYTNQVQAIQVQPDLPSMRALENIYSSPYVQKSLTARFDYRLNDKHNLFLRYSHDGNNGFGPQNNSGAAEPSSGQTKSIGPIKAFSGSLACLRQPSLTISASRCFTGTA